MATLVFSSVDNSDFVLLLKALRLDQSSLLTVNENLNARNLLVIDTVLGLFFMF